jgi:hypothetical protein
MSNPNANAEASAIAASADVATYVAQVAMFQQQISSYQMQITQMTNQLALTQTNLTAAQTSLALASSNYQAALVAILNGFSSSSPTPGDSVTKLPTVSVPHPIPPPDPPTDYRAEMLALQAQMAALAASSKK